MNIAVSPTRGSIRVIRPDSSVRWIACISRQNAPAQLECGDGKESPGHDGQNDQHGQSLPSMHPDTPHRCERHVLVVWQFPNGDGRPDPGRPPSGAGAISGEPDPDGLGLLAGCGCRG